MYGTITHVSATSQLCPRLPVSRYQELGVHKSQPITPSTKIRNQDLFREIKYNRLYPPAFNSFLGAAGGGVYNTIKILPWYAVHGSDTISSLRTRLLFAWTVILVQIKLILKMYDQFLK